MKHKMKRKRRSVGNVKRSETLKSFKKPRRETKSRFKKLNLEREETERNVIER